MVLKAYHGIRQGTIINDRATRDDFVVLLILDLKRPHRQPPALGIVAPALVVVAHVLSEATNEVGHSRFPFETC